MISMLKLIAVAVVLYCGSVCASQIEDQMMRNVGYINEEIVQSVKVLSTKYEMDSRLIMAIMMQESSYNVRAIGKGVDFGLMQVSSRNIRALKLDQFRITNDIRYSVEQGIKILKWFKSKYSKTEELWWCRYNVGTRSLRGRRLKSCKNYVRKVVRWY